MGLFGFHGRARKDFNKKLRRQGQKLRIKQFGSRHKARQASRNGYA